MNPWRNLSSFLIVLLLTTSCYAKDKDFTVSQDKTTIYKWDRECKLEIKSMLKNKPITIEGKKIKQKSKDIELLIYEISPQCNEDYGCSFNNGGLEYEIILKKKPPTNSITLDIDFKNLILYYQGELTQEEIMEGCTRPIGVVSSYAVYHATKSGHEKGKTNYKAGKAFHIYRPKIIDADGKKLWVNFNKNAQITKKLIITIPQTFLDTAKYPITIDPTFGDTNGGASCDTSADQVASIWAAPATGTITSIFFAFSINSPAAGSNQPYKGAFWTDNAGVPNTEVDQGDELDITRSSGSDTCADNVYQESTNLSGAITNAVSYWLGATPEIKNAGVRNMSYDAGVNGYESGNIWTNPGWNDGAAARAGRQYAVYAEYTATPTGNPQVILISKGD